MGLRGPAKKTFEVYKVEGNVGHQKKRKTTVRGSSKCPNPPAGLDYIAKLEWKRLASVLWSKGLLAKEDRALFASYCAAWSRWLKAEKVITKKGLTFEMGEQGYTQVRPEVTISRNAIKTMADLSRRFGFDPRSRQDIEVTETDKPRGYYFDD